MQHILQLLDNHFGIVEESPLVLNKFVTIYSFLIIKDYPSLWTAPFKALVERLGRGPLFVYFFNKVMLELDDSVLCGTVSSTAVRCTSLRDAIRLNDAETLSYAWNAMMNSEEFSKPEFCLLLSGCLTCIGRFALWMDVLLFVNPKMLPALLTNLFSTHVDYSISVAACEAISGIIRKGAPPAQRLTILKEIDVCNRLVPIMQQSLTSTPPPPISPSGKVFAARLNVLKVLLQELTHIDPQIENSIRLLPETWPLMRPCMTVLVEIGQIVPSAISREIISVIADAFGLFKKIEARPPESDLCPLLVSTFRMIVAVLTYDPKSQIDEEELMLSDPNDDNAIALLDTRNQALALLRRIMQTNREFVASLISDAVTTFAASPSPTWMTAESLIQLFNGLDRQSSAEINNSINKSVCNLFAVPLIASPAHPLLRHSLFSLFSRYSSCLSPLETRRAISLCLDEAGLKSSSRVLSTYACTRFERAIHASLKEHSTAEATLRPVARAIISALLPFLSTPFLPARIQLPPQSAISQYMRACGPPPSFCASSSDRSQICLFATAGALVGCMADHQEALEALNEISLKVFPFLSSSAIQSFTADDPEGTLSFVATLIENLSGLVASLPPLLADPLCVSALSSLSEFLPVCPPSPAVRSASLVLVRRCLQQVKDAALPFLSQFLPSLFATSRSLCDLEDLSAFVHQIAAERYTDAAKPQVAELLTRLFPIMFTPYFNQWVILSEDNIEMARIKADSSQSLLLGLFGYAHHFPASLMNFISHAPIESVHATGAIELLPASPSKRDLSIAFVRFCLHPFWRKSFTSSDGLKTVISLQHSQSVKYSLGIWEKLFIAVAPLGVSDAAMVEGLTALHWDSIIRIILQYVIHLDFASEPADRQRAKDAMGPIRTLVSGVTIGQTLTNQMHQQVMQGSTSGARQQLQLKIFEIIQDVFRCSASNTEAILSWVVRKNAESKEIEFDRLLFNCLNEGAGARQL